MTISNTSFPDLTLNIWVNDRKEMIPYRYVIWLKSSRNYTIFILADGRKIISSRNLGSYEKKLPEGFIRVHRSSIVNCEYIKQLNCFQRICILTNGQRVGISERRLRNIMSFKF